jgi:hypothetical protein
MDSRHYRYWLVGECGHLRVVTNTYSKSIRVVLHEHKPRQNGLVVKAFGADGRRASAPAFRLQKQRERARSRCSIGAVT